MKFIPTFVHGVTDYVGALLLFLVPNIFGFADEGGAAVWVPRILALITFLQAIVTDYELGAARTTPMRLHLMNDYVAGIVLAASPWIFGFANARSTAWMPHLVFGILIFVTSALTERQPRGARHAARA